jgi:hypothetical protein
VFLARGSAPFPATLVKYVRICGVKAVKVTSFVQNSSMKKSRKGDKCYILINLYALQDSVVAASVSEVSRVTGVHRNTLSRGINGPHGHYMVVTTDRPVMGDRGADAPTVR